MWPIFEFTHDLFKSDAVDFLDGTPRLQAEGAGHVPNAMVGSQVGDDDKINGCKLVESMLLNLHDHIDYVPLRIHQLQDIIVIATDHINKARPQPFLLTNLENLINTILLNASAALYFADCDSCACFLTAGSCDQHREQDCPCARQQAYLYENERYVYRRHSHMLS
ncbi:hypothetical protein AZE42_12825 [Rhizopogon vesiculosus]|uniref:Uncharacterized protein n=1 Tax=Rhizopogon vesiculosus TaxID=180088 RepID=A0A1J8QCL0_9AGAM|nr:hypothetical protein AZE42_12825 [Rhizopogon vesiculosus]